MPPSETFTSAHLTAAWILTHAPCVCKDCGGNTTVTPQTFLLTCPALPAPPHTFNPAVPLWTWQGNGELPIWAESLPSHLLLLSKTTNHKTKTSKQKSSQALWFLKSHPLSPASRISHTGCFTPALPPVPEVPGLRSKRNFQLGRYLGTASKDLFK